MYRSQIDELIENYYLIKHRFIQSLIEEESDIRIVYCAVAVCYILQDWSSVNRDTIIAHIKSCQNYENAFGQTIGAEAHAGSTFCAIASLELMGQLNDVYDQRKRQLIAEWCLHRQVTGFQGRPHKDPDTCYSFWVGATLTILNSFQFIDDQLHSEFLSTTFDYDGGGFGKYPDTSSGNFFTIYHHQLNIEITLYSFHRCFTYIFWTGCIITTSL